MLYEAVGGLLAGAGLGTLGVDILATLPDRPDDCIAIREYPGAPPIHHKTAHAPVLERPRFQVVASQRLRHGPCAGTQRLQRPHGLHGHPAGRLLRHPCLAEPVPAGARRERQELVDGELRGVEGVIEM